MYKGKVKRKRCGASLPEAVEFFTKALAKDALKNVTLRCANIGFPPPEHLQPHEKLVRKKGKKKPVPVRIVPLKKLNREHGIWWCPYCMKLRRFIKRTVAVVDGIKMPDKAEVCPMCGVSHRDHHVRRWNPIAAELAGRETV